MKVLKTSHIYAILFLSEKQGVFTEKYTFLKLRGREHEKTDTVNYMYSNKLFIIFLRLPDTILSTLQNITYLLGKKCKNIILSKALFPEESLPLISIRLYCSSF